MKSWKHNWAYPEIREFHETVSLFGTLSNTCRPMDTDPHLAYMSTRVLPTTFKLHLFKTLQRFVVMPMFSIP